MHGRLEGSKGAWSKFVTFEVSFLAQFTKIGTFWPHICPLTIRSSPTLTAWRVLWWAVNCNEKDITALLWIYHYRKQEESAKINKCGSPPGVIVADTLSFNAKIGLVDF